MNWWDDDPSDFNALPTRIARRLKNAGLHSIEEVAAAGEQAIRDVPGIGVGALATIKTWLRAAYAAGNVQPERTQGRPGRGTNNV